MTHTVVCGNHRIHVSDAEIARREIR